MLEVIVSAVVGSVVAWLLPAGWNPFVNSRRLARRVRESLRRWHRMRRLRAGKYVERLTIAELKTVLENPGIGALHPQVRADIEEASRGIADAMSHAAAQVHEMARVLDRYDAAINSRGR